ncbi:MAG: galactokinase [Clostridia bacterium]|nr:galactokinase [Clostridia bacterium]
MAIELTKAALHSGAYRAAMAKIYATEAEIDRQTARYISIAEDFAAIYGERDNLRFFSAPGRTEIGGNHTDHNHGKVLAASINLDAVAAAAQNEENIIRVKSRGYSKIDVIDLATLTPVPAETGHSAALIRGVAARLKALGYKIGGFDAATASEVLSGSGLSSSAAFEVLIGTVLNYMYNDGKISPVVIAQVAQYAENVFFGKPCGLMDQMACSVGSFVEIDFADPDNPVINPVSFDFAACGHSLCIVDTRASHADLTDDYAAIRAEMEAVAGCFGKKCLREVDPETVYGNIGAIRKKVGERAVLRAMHFYAENARVDCEANALQAGDFDAFKNYVIESGFSSYMYNQNVFAPKQPKSQPVALALAISESLLADKGAWRVHGGGFAGTIQAFVPNDAVAEYKAALEAVFGEGACYILQIRPIGGFEVKRN